MTKLQALVKLLGWFMPFVKITETGDDRLHTVNYSNDLGDEVEVDFFDGRPQVLKRGDKRYNADGEEL